MNTYDKGGAARAAFRLHKGLDKIGFDSHMFVASLSDDADHVKTYSRPQDIFSRMQRLFRRKKISHSLARYQSTRLSYRMFSDDRSQYGSELLEQLPKSDLIHLHWISGFIDYQLFLSVASKRIPIIWTLHDMNAFTGGCHYDEGCNRYTNSCGFCPQLGSKKENDLSRSIWQRKQKVFTTLKQHRIHFVTPSSWLASEAHRSSLIKDFPISVIPYGLDTQEFAPRDQSFARSVLAIPLDAKVVLFAADFVEEPRKGFSLLLEALDRLKKKVENLYLISFGGGHVNINDSLRHRHLGYIKQDCLLSLVYSAADIFVLPSLQENLGQTALEAMSCGIPIVGFDVGGIQDMVQSGSNGYLVPVADVNALSDAMIVLLQDFKLKLEMSINCRHIAVEQFSLEVQACRYKDLYKEYSST